MGFVPVVGMESDDMGKLTAKTVSSLKDPGMYGDGGGLYLAVGTNGSKSWILRARVKGQVNSTGKPLRIEMGLGSVALVSLAEAREEARRYLKLARAGQNPVEARDRERKRGEALTFEAAARRVHADLEPTFRNPKHAAAWISSLERYAFPTIGQRRIENIASGDVLEVLSPIWTAKNDTARRVKQRMAAVFDWAKGSGHYPHENPVNGLKKALPKVKRDAEHMAALPWRDVPAFWETLSGRESVAARCLEFIILTAARSNEARGARWAEIDLDAGTWTVSAERMKRGVAHRVPLAPEALEVLEAVRGLDSEFVFPSPQRGQRGEGRPLSVNAFRPLLARMGHTGLSVHGFRSSFRDWCSESAHADREVAEAALSHAAGDAVERAYARSDLFERRRDLMEAWAQYATGAMGQVVRLVRP